MNRLSDIVAITAAAAIPAVPSLGALTFGAWSGYCHGQGMPVENAGWYLAGTPAVSGVVLSPYLRSKHGNEADIIRRAMYRGAVVGSAVLGPLGYGLGYVAGKVAS